MTLGKILILNEERVTNSEEKRILRRFGYEVIQEIIGSNLRKQVIRVLPDIILLDINCEKDNFIETLETLQREKVIHGIPIIGILKNCDRDKKAQCIINGIKDYIETPIQEVELILKVKNQLEIVKLQCNLNKTQKALEESISTIKKQRLELEHNLSMASKIQEALIPKTLGSIPNCSFTWHFQPSGKVGGDIFDVFMLDADHVGFYVIDVMGHGLASSMLAVALSEFLILDVDRGSPLKRKLNTHPYYEIVSPIEVVEYLNKRFPFTKYQHYFTIFYMILNTKTGVGKYVRGAHPSPIVVRNNGEIIELDGYGTPVGFELAKEYEEKTVYFESGDNLIIYTDGLLELKDEDGNTLEYDGLMKYIQNEVKRNDHNHYLTLGLNNLINRQTKLKDDLSILEMKWVKFI